MSQVVEFFAAPGQTVTAQLYSAGSDTLVSSQSATEATSRKGVYTATYTGVAAGTYRVLALVGSTPIATWWVDLLAGSATYIAYEMPLAVQTASVYNASPSAGWTNGSFGDRFLVSASAQRTVSVTGSNHVASVVHSMEPNVLTASALASDAASEIATAVEATQALSRLDSMIESDGAGQFRFDTIALSMAAGGGGASDWTANERTAIRSILGFDSGGTVSLPTVGVMDSIKDKTDLITSGNISVLPDRVNNDTITMQFNESTTATVNLDEDTTSATLQFVIARPDGTDVLTIPNGSITRTSSSFTVTITTTVTSTIGQYLWSLRDLTGGANRVVTKGVLTVQNAAAIDA